MAAIAARVPDSVSFPAVEAWKETSAARRSRRLRASRAWVRTDFPRTARTTFTLGRAGPGRGPVLLCGPTVPVGPSSHGGGAAVVGWRCLPARKETDGLGVP